MASKKKGLITVSGQWAKHLRMFWKKKFWKAERRATKEVIKKSRVAPEAVANRES